MAVAQIQFTQGANVGGDGQSVIGFSIGLAVNMTDKGGASATSYLWEIVNWPAPLSAPPAVTSSTTQIATTYPLHDGVYIVRLTREDIVDGVTVDTKFFGVNDTEGHIIPSAGMSGRITNVGTNAGLAQTAGWMGRADASTNVFMDAILRWLKEAAKNAQVFPIVSGAQSHTTEVGKRIGTLRIDPTTYPSYSTAKFQVILEATTGKTAEALLYNVTDGGVVSGSTLTSTSTTPEVKEATVTLPSAQKDYEVQLRMTVANAGSDLVTCTCARLLLAW
jgi:hypothetical protein